mmetsp:Transcript_59452/g.159208  ORF Transcript_59452/g.159208 Transcript_59452/m.159208 type:complete len:349 (-) Transcript_59452:88-1134(-)
MRQTLLLLELGLCGLVGVAALRTQEETAASQSTLDHFLVKGAGVKSGKLPPPEILERLWRRNLQKERQSGPFPPDVKIVLGVFASETDPRYSEVVSLVRQTWFSQRGVCPLRLGMTQECTVYVAFVLGTALSGYQPDREPDVLVLDVAENMNKGKTFAFFEAVSRLYPWATHVGKMDTDTFPYLHRLSESLHAHAKSSKCPNHFVGDPMNHARCGYWDWCPPASCSLPVGEDFLKFDRSRADGPHCWSYMQGGMYVVSSGLLRSVAVRGHTIWDNWQTGVEDVVTGRVIGLYAKIHELCVSTWNPYAWDHLSSMYNRTAPNHTVTPVRDDEWLSLPSAYDMQPDSQRT